MTDLFSARLADRAILDLSGPDLDDFLQGIITQNVERVCAGEAIFSALLTPQGKILFDFFLLPRDDGDGFFLDCHSEAVEALAKRLKFYRLRAKVDIKVRPDLSVFAYWSDDAHATGPQDASRDPRLVALGWRKIAETDAIDIAQDDYHAHRIALGVPQAIDDFGAEEVFLLDVNYDALAGVDYQKGCFVGQEVTSRMKRKAAARKRTYIFEHEADPAPEKAAALTADETPLGAVMSGATGRALAVIRLDRLENARDANAGARCGAIEGRLSPPPYAL